MPAIEPTDMLRVKNVGDKPAELRYDGRAVTVRPGKTAMASFDQVANALGHPWAAPHPTKYESSGVTYHIPSRGQEIGRLSLKYGAFLPDSAGEKHASGLGLAALIPDLEIYDQDGMDQGNRVLTVVDDPSGAHFAPPAAQNVSAGDQIARLERQMSILRAQINGQPEEEDVNAGEIPEDK